MTRALPPGFERETTMKIDLIGCGCGAETLTAEAQAALTKAELVLGAPRLLCLAPEGTECMTAKTANEILACLTATEQRRTAVLFSGDSGFYSGLRLLLPELGEHEVRIFPGISSLQLFAARLGRPWQDWRLVSAHGTDCDPVSETCRGHPVFFLTGGKYGPSLLCRKLTEAGLGFLAAAVGENLGEENERIWCGLAAEASIQSFEPLSVLLVDAAPRIPRRTPGLPDAAFLRREGIPMTKQEVRAAVLAKLAVAPGEICWDIGTGTGSAGIELALQAGQVWSVERIPEALELAEENRRRLGAWNLHLVAGEAPEALSGLPTPNAVFVGGSGGRLVELLTVIHAAAPEARVCISAVTPESMASALQSLQNLGYETELCQIAVSRGCRRGESTLMLAQNPVWLITGMRA